MDWSELGKRIAFLEQLFSDRGIEIRADGGLAAALAEAKALVAGTKLPEEPSATRLAAIAHDAHVIWALTQSLETCVKAGLDVSNHLAQMTAGTTDYGTGSDKTNEIYFKDFECELFVAATLLRSGQNAGFLPDPDDPGGDLIVEPIRVEVKHPNSLGQLKKLLRKFNGKLYDEKLYGVFVVGIEDAFDMGDQPTFDTPIEFGAWLDAKRTAMDVSVQRAAS